MAMETQLVSDARQLRQVYGTFPTGVIAFAAFINGAPVGLAASSFTSVSIDPPLVSVSMAHTSTTWPLLRRAPSLGVSVLSSGQDVICRQLSAKEADRFAGVDWSATDEGAVLIAGAAAWLLCRVHDVVRAGDHDVVLLAVDELAVSAQAEPLVFHGSRFRRLDPASLG
jgi:flavin reductase (DIM6/NTAB) family NADH-FMN oxidoreductase RutF